MVIYLWHGRVLSNEKEQITDTYNNLYDSPENYVEWKKKSIQKVTYFINLFRLYFEKTKFLNWQTD